MPPGQIVVFDSNVLIPLVIPAGRSRSTRLFNRLRKLGWRVALTPQLLAEVEEKLRTGKRLRKWLNLTDDKIEKFLKVLPTLCMPVPGNLTVAGVVQTDPKDDKVVAAAVESGASHIVSQDHHLRDLGEYQGITIISIAELEAELDRPSKGQG
jgi:putative PIN family toxin of toxin-antitoxin system